MRKTKDIACDNPPTSSKKSKTTIQDITRMRKAMMKNENKSSENRQNSVAQSNHSKVIFHWIPGLC